MQFKFNPRNWHKWLSVALVMPILIIALTAVLMAHNKRLGLNQINVSGAVSWLPGYAKSALKQETSEIRTSLTTECGTHWLGTKSGLYRLVGDAILPIQELAGIEIRDLATAPWGIVVATRNGIWVEQQGVWHLALKGDAWNVSVSADGMAAASIRDKGLVMSRDGSTWASNPAIEHAMSTLSTAMMTQERVTLGKLVMDMHTGKAFLGKRAEWVWIDTIGLTMTFLGVTGVYMWWRSKRRKRAMAA